jgi:hypothetical protein
MNTRFSQAAFADLDSNGEPPDPLEQWVSPPFEPTIRNGRLCPAGRLTIKDNTLRRSLVLNHGWPYKANSPAMSKWCWKGREGEEEIGGPSWQEPHGY